jgi:membrane-bound lytic murein transglycosylase D
VSIVQASPTMPVAVEAAPVVEPAAVTDPIQRVLDEADRRFEDGRRELSLGHLAGARKHFNEAIEGLLSGPDGAQSDGRLRDHLDRLVDRIAALELTAFATGDGFTEQTAEPASIDSLLEISVLETAPPAAATVEHVLADLEATTHDIPIPLNERVLRFVEIFQGGLRDFLTSGLERGAQYLPMIQAVFRAEGLPLDLAYIPLVESAFKPTALSRAKARGVWQFMRGTGVENGLQSDWFVDERSDPEKATVAAAKYLKMLHGMFGDWHLALASYNGGYGRIQRAMKRSGRHDFWSLTATSRYLPRETRNYVPMILAAVIIAKNPTQYGFDIVPTAAPAVELVTVPAAVDLRRVAEWAGVPAEDVQRLNPELRRWTTPIRGDGYELRVPGGTADFVRAGLAEASPAELNALQWHTVKRGETLSSIARRLSVSRTDLADANYLKASARVNVGQRLLIPRMPSATLLARAAAGDAVPAVADASRPSAIDDGASDEVQRITHRVKAGESLYSIARRYQTTVDALKTTNNLRSSVLQIGMRLVVSTARGVATQQQ